MSQVFKPFTSKRDASTIDSLDQAFAAGMDTAELCERLLVGETFDDEQRKVLFTKFRWWWVGGLSRQWVREQQRMESRNTFHGVAWNWEWMKARRR